jgi:hypothetical protein
MRFDAMAVDVKTMNEDVRGLRQQIKAFREDLDSVKRRATNSDKAPVVPPSVDVASASGTAARGAVLVNNGPLLLNTPPALGYVFHMAPSSPQGGEDYHKCPPRHDFPWFHGERLILWFDMCLTYFDLFKTLTHQWVGTTTLYLEGHVALWYQAYKRQHLHSDWDSFKATVIEEFGREEYDGQMHKLMQLQQTGSVVEYRTMFDECMYHLLSLDSSLNNRWFVTQFVFGLRDDIRGAVRLQGPTSVTRATAFARIKEEELEHHRPRTKAITPTKHPPGNVAVPALAGRVPRQDWPGRQVTRG